MNTEPFLQQRAATAIDPLAGPHIALAGRVVTMDDSWRVIDAGVVYIANGAIQSTQERSEPAPAGFENAPIVDTRGTLFPGLIELHNHLSYNVLPLWDVPKAFSNREGWGGTAEYRKRISGPMTVVGRTPRLLPALIRYVECKCLMGGVTTTQGIMLASNAGVRRFYRGLVRNVEQTDDVGLPEAAARIDDIDAGNAEWFLNRLKKQSCFLLHLAEGIDERARAHFLALQMGGDWAITGQLAGIHCAGLSAQDFDILSQHGGAMVWSPFSNLLLYGKTADIKAARAAGVRIGIGCDWTPSGSKNLLGELKVAKLHSEAQGGVFSDREIVAMATRSAADILQWQGVLGVLRPGARADILVISGHKGDPYGALIGAAESDISLVMINGVARFGLPSLMKRLNPICQSVVAGGVNRRIFLEQATQDPDVATVSLSTAVDMMREALRELPALASELEKPKPVPRDIGGRALDQPDPVIWSLALDEIHDTGVDLRPRLPFGKDLARSGPSRATAVGKALLSEILEPIQLDPLTVHDDADFLDRVSRQRNLPTNMGTELANMY